MMLPSEFFKLYIPALEIALESDSQNLGYYVKGPEDYLDDSLLPSIDEFIESKSAYSPFLDMVGIYFDARSHYFTEIDGENINHFKGRIANCLEKYKKEFKIDNWKIVSKRPLKTGGGIYWRYPKLAQVLLEH